MQEKFNVLVLFNKSASLKVLLNMQKMGRDTLRGSLWVLPFPLLKIAVEVSLRSENWEQNSHFWCLTVIWIECERVSVPLHSFSKQMENIFCLKNL